MLAFARALPRIRRRVKRDLARRGMPREKVLATVVRLLETTLIRVGNDEYARENNSYGLTTMCNGHARVARSRIRFSFRGKSKASRDQHLRSAARAHRAALPGDAGARSFSPAKTRLASRAMSAHRM